MKTVRAFGLSLLVGLAAVTMVLVGGRHLGDSVPEWLAQLAWVSLTTVGSFGCGHLYPEESWRWGAVAIGVQPFGAALGLYLVGEFERPSSPFGAGGALLVFSIVALVVSPLPVGASHYAGLRRQEEATSQSPPGEG